MGKGAKAPIEPATLAEASRQRRDLVSGEVMEEARLIRFVISPEGVVFADLGRRLPGRGLWVEATRGAVEAAVKRQAFSRGAKKKVTAPADLADQVDRLLLERLLAGLGMARRAGDLISGFDTVDTAVRAGKVAFLIEATDSAADGRRKLSQAAHAAGLNAKRKPQTVGIFNSVEMGLALGLINVIHLGFLAGRGAENWAMDLERLAGFRPLNPPSWNEAD